MSPCRFKVMDRRGQAAWGLEGVPMTQVLCGDRTWRGRRGGPGLKAIGGQLDKLSIQGGEGRAWGLDAFQGEQRTCMWGEAGAGMAGRAGVTELLQSHRLAEAEPTGRRGPEVPSQETNRCLQEVSVAGGPRGLNPVGEPLI